MFSRAASRCSRRFTQARTLASNAAPRASKSASAASGAILLVTGALGGYALQRQIGEVHSDTKDWTVTENIQKKTLEEPSTTPLSSVEFPRYATDAEFAEALKLFKQIVGEDKISAEAEVIAEHADSFFNTHHPPKPDVQRPAVVISPTTTKEVSEILKVAHKYRVPIVANSGLTSLEGHNMHTRGPNSVSLSFGDMSDIRLNADDMDAVVQAGVGWKELDEYLLDSDDGSHLMFGPDPGIGATIGGMVGTSASGTNAYRYGTMKENILGLTVVLADGTVVKTRQRPRKSSAGYDLTRLFIGSEGTLGIVTEITVKLQPRPIKELVSIATFPTIKDAASAAQHIISRSGIQPNAVELVNETTMSFVNASGVSDKKFMEKPSLLLKIGGPSDAIISEQLNIVEKVVKENNSINFENSKSEDENEILWAARRAGLWSTFDYGKTVLEDKNDVQLWTTDFAVPISRMATLINETNDDLNLLGFRNRFSVLGHIGDGNCHFLLIYNSKDYAKTKEVVDRMVERALKLEGTCTGEHGVGVGKRSYLEPEIGKNAVDLMRHVKFSLDPRAILNPDKIFKIDPNENLDALLDLGHAVEVPKCC